MNHEYGDATKPYGKGHKLILHCCNSEGKWGAGFVLALSKKWPHVEQAYRRWFRASKDGGIPSPDERVEIFSDDEDNYLYGFHLGAIQVVDVAEDISVVNMIGQDGCGPNKYGHVPIRYYAIDECLRKVAQVAVARKSSIHLPFKMCCGLAGGNWDYIKMMLNTRLIKLYDGFEPLDVTAYEYQP